MTDNVKALESEERKMNVLGRVGVHPVHGLLGVSWRKEDVNEHAVMSRVLLSS